MFGAHERRSPMTRGPNSRHDPERFYHCDCRDEGGEEHDDRFYHCHCIEEGYDPDAAAQAPGKDSEAK
jgi:hypothetical protein